MQKQIDDNRLAKLAGNGDAAAFRHLLERHYDTLYRLAYRAMGRQEDAEDLTQEICASLPRRLKSFRGQARFETWLYRVVLNAAHDDHRRRIRRQRLANDFSAWSELAKGDSQARARDEAWLYEMLEHVSDDIRKTALLVLAEQMSHGEAAAILSIKESTVSWRMHELRKALKAMVAKGEAHA